MNLVRAINQVPSDEMSYSEYANGQQISDPIMIESGVRV